MASLRDPQSSDSGWEKVLAAYANALEQGQNPPRELWLQRYPQFAKELREYIDNQNLLEQCFQSLRAAVYPPAGAGVLTSPPQPDGELPLPEVG